MHNDAPVSPAEAVAKIKAMQPDSTKFCVRKCGFVDWKFGELAAYRGYAAAVDYVESVRRWRDFSKYQDCLLIQTYNAFLEAEKSTT